MADMFRKGDAENCLMGKKILFLGDSNIRCLYKDLVWFLQNNSLISANLIKKRLENSFIGDRLINGDKLHSGRHYIEDRAYTHLKNKGEIFVEYSFLSRCYSPHIIDIFERIKKDKSQVDLIIMNSTLWDINRWGPDGVVQFKENLVKLMKLVKESISPDCIFLWLTALPVSSEILSSLLIKEIEFLQYSMRFNVMEANNYARQVVSAYGFDLLDLHFYCRMQLQHRNKDGIHFQPLLVRFVTNLILTHVCLSWNYQLPGNVNNIALRKCKNLVFQGDENLNSLKTIEVLNKIKKMVPNKMSEMANKKPSTKSLSQAKPVEPTNKAKPLLSDPKILNQTYSQSNNCGKKQKKKRGNYRPAPYKNCRRGNNRYDPPNRFHSNYC